jgi:hypothetical protein
MVWLTNLFVANKYNIWGPTSLSLAPLVIQPVTMAKKKSKQASHPPIDSHILLFTFSQRSSALGVGTASENSRMRKVILIINHHLHVFMSIFFVQF